MFQIPLKFQRPKSIFLLWTTFILTGFVAKHARSRGNDHVRQVAYELRIPKIPDFSVADGRDIGVTSILSGELSSKSRNLAHFAKIKFRQNCHFFVRKVKMPKWGISGRPT